MERLTGKQATAYSTTIDLFDDFELDGLWFVDISGSNVVDQDEFYLEDEFKTIKQSVC